MRLLSTHDGQRVADALRQCTRVVLFVLDEHGMDAHVCQFSPIIVLDRKSSLTVVIHRAKAERSGRLHRSCACSLDVWHDCDAFRWAPWTTNC
eukprot:scaffold218107_cov38-Prasinocladus_malaysianus.AAC.1